MTRTVAACSYRLRICRSPAFLACSAVKIAFLVFTTILLPIDCRGSGPAALSPGAALYTDRGDALSIERSRQLLREGQVIEAVAHLQRILDAPADSFAQLPQGTTGARRAAQSLLETLPKSERALHGALQTAAASAAFQDAIERQDESALRDVVQRFATTEVGFQAANRVALTAFDRGDFATAARLWDGLLRDPSHHARVTPSIVARTLVALRRCGRDGRASELAIRFSGVQVHFEGRRSTISSLLKAVEPWSPSLPTTGMVHTAAEGLSPPAYPPVWHHEPDEGTKVLYEMWSSSHRSEGRPLATAVGAVFASGSIIVRDLAGIAAFDSETGGRLWHGPLLSILGNRTERDTSDIHGLAKLEELYASNGIYGQISTDGERIYVVERHDRAVGAVRTASHPPVPAYDRPPISDSSNRLIAFPLDPTAGEVRQPYWIAGQHPSDTPHDTSGHFFLGTPLSVGTELLAITEKQRQLNLVSLAPETGEFRWQQPLGFVPRSISSDPVRAASPCRPVVAEGIAVCATNAGFIVAYDAIAGRLLWAYEYDDAEERTRQVRDDSPERTASYGDPAFPSPVLIRGRNVLLLPPDSRHVHCVDLVSGGLQWTAPREDALYVACLTDSVVVVVGRSVCRAYSLASGSLLWKTHVGTPAGSGVVTEGSYLLPLENGTIVGIDLASGRSIGFDVPRESSDFTPISGSGGHHAEQFWRPGNLYTLDGSLYSVGATGLARLSTASSVLASQAPPEPLEQARLELAAGELTSARNRLQALSGSGGSPAVMAEATKLLRELNYLRLSWEPLGESAEILAELDQLSATPIERGRFLLQAAEHDLALGDRNALERRTRELSSLDLEKLLPRPNDPTHLVTAASWLPRISNAVADHDLGLQSTDDLNAADTSEDELHRLLLFEPTAPVAAEIRLELARRAAANGDLHESELHLLRASVVPDLQAQTLGELAKLSHRGGLTTPQGGNFLGREIDSVQVTGRLWAPASDRMCQTFGRSRGGFLARSQKPVRVVNRGDSRQARLAVVDLVGGVCLGEFKVEPRLRFPSLGRQSSQGHFIPVATPDRIYGLSLLEAGRGTPVWEQELPEHDGLLPQLGPYGPSFCTVQTRRELTVLDPRDGSVIWQRIDLPSDRGLNGDHTVGLFGDEEVLALLDSDGLTYTTFETQTGERLSRGELPIDHRRQRRAYGRRLFFVETTDAGSYARLWDPASQSYDLDIPFEGRLLETSTRGEHLALLFPDGQFKIHDPATGTALIDLQLDPPEVANAHTIQVFSDEECFYVSLYQLDPDRFENSRVAHYVYDTPLSTAHVQGRLIAIDRKTSQIRWSRPTDQRSILDPVEHPSPFLVAIARMSDSAAGNRKTLLVEVLDKRTGFILGRNDALLPDQLLQCLWDEEKNRVELMGMTSTVVLDFREQPLDDRPIATLQRSRKTKHGNDSDLP